MKARIMACLAVATILGASIQNLCADGILKHHRGAAPPVCEPGYQLIEEIVYHDVVKTVCRMVPETKKKWVYSQIDEPFCIRDCKLHPHHKCECEEGCKAICRPRLVKIQVEEECPHMKCVAETIVEKVACKVYRKVPIGTAPAQIAPPAAGNAPTIEVIPSLPMPVEKKK